jgi:hypothetical protein
MLNFWVDNDSDDDFHVYGSFEESRVRTSRSRCGEMAACSREGQVLGVCLAGLDLSCRWPEAPERLGLGTQTACH